MDDLNNLLSSLHQGGEVVSSGKFTLDLRKAREKLRKFQLAEPCFYLMKVLQAAVSAGAERVEIVLGRRTVGFYACFPPGSPLSQAQPLVDGLQDPQGVPAGPMRHLAIGLNSAWAVEPAFVSVAFWSQATRNGWKLVVGQEEIQLQPCPECPPRPAPEHFPWMDRLEFVLERDTSVSSYVKSVASEHLGILHRCAFCPVPLFLDSRRVLGQFAPAEKPTVPSPEQGAPYLLAERFVLDPDGGFQMCAPPWSAVGTTDNSLINRTELVVKDGAPVRCPTFSYQGQFERKSGDTVRARLALALPSSTSGASRIVLVKDGVTLEPVAPRKMTHIGLQAIVSAPDIKVDLSEFTAVQDEALEEHLDEVLRELGHLLEEVKPLSQYFPMHRIDNDSAGILGCGYLLGCIFFNILGVGLVALYQWFSSKGVQRAHIENRNRLRERLRQRLEELSRTLSPPARKSQ